jgi:hypothetical protein
VTQIELKAALQRIVALRRQADDEERAVILAVLQETRGMVSYAADLLGFSRKRFAAMLRHQFPDLKEQARTMRTAAGYVAGNPMLKGISKPIPTV